METERQVLKVESCNQCGTRHLLRFSNPMKYYCLSEKCRKVVSPVQGYFNHPHLGRQDCKVCPFCGAPVVYFEGDVPPNYAELKPDSPSHTGGEAVKVVWRFGFNEAGEPIILYRFESEDFSVVQQITPENAKKLAKMLEILILTDWVKQGQEKMNTIADIEMMFNSKFGRNNG